MPITYGSVCSGIEAATVAWHPLGWRAEWFAEVEPFPSAVLAYRWPEVSNLGDMTMLARQVLTGAISAPEVLVGGTPCQAFSVAGMRAGLDDPRGQLTIKYVDLADAVDHVRAARGEAECVVVWENVPGVLSDKGNAFGCFLGALVGESDALQPSGGKWTDAGCVYGPVRTAAWRVLDAQYFGLAQRRRRVFVVASARKGFDPAAVLFEFDGVRRDTAPSREAGQEAAATLDARAEGGGFPGTDGACGGHVVPVAFGGENQGGSLFQAGALNAHGLRNDFATETFCVQGVDVRNGQLTGDVAHTVQAGAHAPDPGGTPHVIAVHGTQDPDLRYEQAHTLGRNSGQENAVFAIQDGAMRENPSSGPQGLGVQSDLAYTLEARAAMSKVQDFAVALRGREGGATAELGDDLAGTLRASSGGGDKPHALVSSAVRRITPREAERLQGMPDDYTLIPWRGKPAEECPDGPRYKAIGNSKAVPVVRWIGRRIQLQLL